jgi:hypothetical protein
MTEDSWHSCQEPDQMLAFLGDSATPRKLRLLDVACCRRVWRHLSERGRRLVRVLEEYADGEATEAELVWAVHEQDEFTDDGDVSRYKAADIAADPDGNAPEEESWACELASQTQLLRDLFGIPFRPRVLAPAWLSWGGGVAPHMAEEAYRLRNLPTGTLDNGRLAVLADALEEAGCADEAMLGHLRLQGAVHVRGCWVVDLLLGKG